MYYDRGHQSEGGKRMLEERRDAIEVHPLAEEPSPADPESERVRRALERVSTEDFITLAEWRERIAPHLNGTSR
ncbi:MAG: hypothetical protein HY437_00600 [Candidatus Magasanikbacteria bacterium]|nr:hypothetical protein [Candidatus Magasanikbacteria bacterium]